MDPLSADEDASSRLMTVLVGAAAAHWHYRDVLTELITQPGLEWARTTRDGSGRKARPARGQNSTAAALGRM